MKVQQLKGLSWSSNQDMQNMTIPPLLLPYPNPTRHRPLARSFRVYHLTAPPPPHTVDWGRR